MSPQFAIVVLISGRGSNLRSLIENSTHYRIAAVISNRSDALGLAVAKSSGIPAISIGRERFPSLTAQKEAIFKQVVEFSPDLVALAGFMQIVPTNFVNAFLGRLINIHPALLPKFPGLDTHRRALSANEKQHGCSVHYVDTGVDTGPIIAQAGCPILPGDTEDLLAARVLQHEHCLYPWVANQIASGNITFRSGAVEISPAARLDAFARSFTLP